MNIESASLADKHNAFAWYNKWASIEKVKPNQTYAQALAKNSDKKLITNGDDKNAVFVSKIRKPRSKISFPKRVLHSVTTPKPKSAHCAIKNLPSCITENAPFPENNIFQILQDLNAQDDSTLEVSTETCVSEAFGTENLDNKNMHSLQYSKQCKHLRDILGMQLQPQLAGKANTGLKGNINKTGFFIWNLSNTKSDSDECITKNSSQAQGYTVLPDVPCRSVPWL